MQVWVPRLRAVCKKPAGNVNKSKTSKNKKTTPKTKPFPASAGCPSHSTDDELSVRIEQLQPAGQDFACDLPIWLWPRKLPRAGAVSYSVYGRCDASLTVNCKSRSLTVERACDSSRPRKTFSRNKMVSANGEIDEGMLLQKIYGVSCPHGKCGSHTWQ